jgi:hypothetical protein
MATTALTWHATAPRGLRRLTAMAGPAGVVLGRQHSGALAPVRLFRPEPTRVGVVGGSWLTALIVFRCLGAGARVEITTAMPSRWADVGQLAGVPERFAVGASDIGRSLNGEVLSGSMLPVLRLNDVGLGGGTESVPLGPWETLLTAVGTLTPTTAGALTESNVVILQRLSRDEAEVCAATLHLSPEVETRLHQMHDDMLVVVVSGVPQFLWFATTPIEEQLLGQPRRGDRAPMGMPPPAR